ncbi:MAG TPA: amidohydrolase family protein, partial [Spongiibacteraceae bacterium]
LKYLWGQRRLQENNMLLDGFELFDSHLHIIDKIFPLVPNNGFTPEEFTHKDYLKQVSNYQLIGGAIVSGSFQAFDQSYLIAALKSLGPSFVGVTQLPASVADEEIMNLNELGVRALRFNLKRGGSEAIRYLSSMATRIHDLAGWHVELYVDSYELDSLFTALIRLPAVSIDHLGLSKSGFKQIVTLAEKGVKIKATGFGRVDFNVTKTLKDLYAANPESLMFGTDLPSTRSPSPYKHSDFLLVLEALGQEAAQNVFSKNAINFYRPRMS